MINEYMTQGRQVMWHTGTVVRSRGIIGAITRGRGPIAYNKGGSDIGEELKG